MITHITAMRIWECYREIATAETLLSDMRAELAEANEQARIELDQVLDPPPSTKR